MLSFEKVMTHAQMVIDTDFHTFAIHSDQHNYANNIKMMKGVHQLTLSPNILISLIDHFTIFNRWMDSQADPWAELGFFVTGGGGGGCIQVRRSEYRIRTWDQCTRKCTHTITHTQSHTHSCFQNVLEV